jgi:hypothetical protein
MLALTGFNLATDPHSFLTVAGIVLSVIFFVSWIIGLARR